MRISDWSSDVCSSDLARRKLLAVPDRLDLTLRHAEDRDFRCIDDRREETAADAAERRDRKASAFHFISFQFRSEEHTSELQSLMRISYAVFCLKKKKNKIRIESQHSKPA